MSADDRHKMSSDAAVSGRSSRRAQIRAGGPAIAAESRPPGCEALLVQVRQYRRDERSLASPGHQKPDVTLIHDPD